MGAFYAHMSAFDLLSAAEKAAAVRRMAVEGHSDHAIASATRLAVEQVRHVIAQANDRRAATRRPVLLGNAGWSSREQKPSTVPLALLAELYGEGRDDERR